MYKNDMSAPISKADPIFKALCFLTTCSSTNKIATGSN
ncbi:hypothetical protein PCARR_a3484 [Pseudoalteromonas carrageenovora IAM 12662]|uniref:Uncharacterized protein n=1 Tax=Pseudoalteromonas carrageenovora IAM 12662 TaxID=1314868 RepID=A0ABR9EMB0_PSEVC|nr:hypothetical protein [Pseudoalteromonas carrageenovora IAM 12662]